MQMNFYETIEKNRRSRETLLKIFDAHYPITHLRNITNDPLKFRIKKLQEMQNCVNNDKNMIVDFSNVLFDGENTQFAKYSGFV